MRTTTKALAVTAVLLAGGLAAGCDAGDGPPADLILTGGRVWTGAWDAPRDVGVAVTGGRIAVVAPDREIEARRGPETRTVDLDGRLVVPGFIDAHTHFISGGFQLSSVQLRDADTPEEFTRRIEAFAAGLEGDRWITGGTWDHELWGGELPRRGWIDPVTPETPVFVERLDGHMALANTEALERAGVTAETPDPDGGTVVRDPETGEPTGILKDAAMGLVRRVIPSRSEAELDDALAAAAEHALSRGVTQVHDMGSWSHLETYRRAREAGRLPLRVYSFVPISTWERLGELVRSVGRGDDRLWWGGLKGFVDGSLGSTTAWFYEPYADAPETTGLMTTDTAALRRWITAGDRAGLHVAVHAIGDRANDWLLDVYADARERHPGEDHRLRIEHAQHLSREAFPRFAGLDVIASMQPYHAIDDGRWAGERIGPERIRTTYAFRSLLDAGATLAFGSDWTVAPIDPLMGVYAAVTRRTLDGENPDGWVPEEEIGVAEALRAYTEGGARAGYMEEVTGAVAPGMYADLAVISRDLFEVPPEEIADARVDLTVVEGEIVHRRER